MGALIIYKFRNGSPITELEKLRNIPVYAGDVVKRQSELDHILGPTSLAFWRQTAILLGCSNNGVTHWCF